MVIQWDNTKFHWNRNIFDEPLASPMGGGATKLLRNQDHRDCEEQAEGREFPFWCCPDCGPRSTCLLWFVDRFVSLDKDQALFVLSQHCVPLPEFLSWSFYLDSEEHHLIGQRLWDLKYGRESEMEWVSPAPPLPVLHLNGDLDLFDEFHPLVLVLEVGVCTNSDILQTGRPPSIR